MRSKAAPVATVDCPVKGCNETANVYKYAARSEDDKRRRFAGRLYCRCATHGKLDCNEYILDSESTKWDGEKPKADTNAPLATEQKPAVSAVPKAPQAPVKPVKQQQQQQQQTPEQTKRNRWGWFT